VNSILCGVDVSRDFLDACLWPSEASGRFANTVQGYEELEAFCARHSVTLVVMEATAGYERGAYTFLWQENRPCAIVNPREVRDFARAMGTLEKTDALDARLIARFAHVRETKPGPRPTKAQSELKAFAGRLRQLARDISQQKQRRAFVREPLVLAQIDTLIVLLESQARDMESRIFDLIESDPVWARLNEALREIKGVANRTVACLMAEMPELGTLSNKAIAKLAGLAPLARDSGKSQGKRSIRGGRSPVRTILFLIAHLARQFHEGLRNFYQRLKDQNKPVMVIRIALARKLLTILNAKARDARKEMQNAT
jgi:transposase